MAVMTSWPGDTGGLQTTTTNLVGNWADRAPVPEFRRPAHRVSCRGDPVLRGRRGQAGDHRGHPDQPRLDTEAGQLASAASAGPSRSTIWWPSVWPCSRRSASAQPRHTPAWLGQAVPAPGTGEARTGAPALRPPRRHASFAPRNREQIDLLAHLLYLPGHVAVEQVRLRPRPSPPCSTSWHAAARRLLRLEKDRTPQACAALQPGRRTGLRDRGTLRLLADILADEPPTWCSRPRPRRLFIGGPRRRGCCPFSGRFMAVFACGAHREMLAPYLQVILNPQTVARPSIRKLRR